MLNENAKKWVKALRSGEFKQGTGYLRKGDKFCCLGVACAVYQDEVGTLEVKVSLRGAGEGSDVTSFNSLEGQLPTEVRNWLGLDDGQGAFRVMEDRFESLGNAELLDILGVDDDNPVSSDYDWDLIQLNDDRCLDFNSIANVIEAQPFGLFRYSYNKEVRELKEQQLKDARAAHKRFTLRDGDQESLGVTLFQLAEDDGMVENGDIEKLSRLTIGETLSLGVHAGWMHFTRTN